MINDFSSPCLGVRLSPGGTDRHRHRHRTGSEVPGLVPDGTGTGTGTGNRVCARLHDVGSDAIVVGDWVASAAPVVGRSRIPEPEPEPPVPVPVPVRYRTGTDRYLCRDRYQ